MDNPFQLDVYNKDREWQGRIGDPVSVDGSVKCNALGNFQIRVKGNDPMVEDILAKGARLSMGYLPATERAAIPAGVSPVYPGLMSGMIRTQQGSVLPNGDVVFQVQDDWRVLINTLALIRPNGIIAPTSLSATVPESWAQAWLPGGGADAGPDGTIQGQYGYYLWPDGSAAVGGVYVAYAEDAIKHIIAANTVRLGLKVTVEPQLSRGGDARAAGVLPLVRMSTLAEAVQPLLDWSGLVLTVMQHYGQQYVHIDVREPETWAAPLTVGSGIVQDGSWSTSAPTVTRTVVGGPGEDVARAFWAVNDATGLEDDYGDIIEIFRDATGANLTWPPSITDDLLKIAKYFLLRPEPDPTDQANFIAYLTSAGAKGLAAGLPTASAQVTLSETESFYFGGADGIQLGDWATVETSAGDLYTQQITEAKFSLTKDAFTVEPILGTKTDDPMQTLANAIAKLAAAQRRVSTSR